MSIITDASWFTEVYEPYNTAFSLRLKGPCLHKEKTAYQQIEIYDTVSFGRLMVIDGFVMLTSFDNFFYHEMLTHPALFTHPNPKNIVIIGGGDCGTLREVLKHNTALSAIQVEIDEQVTKLAEEYFPELCVSNTDPRAKLIFDDGIQWMKNAPSESVDIIIIDSTDPVGPAEGLFNLAFYQQCHRVLRSDGILAQQTESPLFHQALIGDIHSAMLQAGFNNQQLIPFPQPVYPSGWWSATLASKKTSLKQFRETAAKNKDFKTKYYNSSIHKGILVGLPEFLL